MSHYQIDASEEGEDSIGQAAICIGEMNPNAMLSHVNFVPAPPALGCVKFGEATIYAEVKFTTIKNATPHTIGILWVPDLFCVDKLWFNDQNYLGAIHLLMTVLAWKGMAIFLKWMRLCAQLSTRSISAFERTWQEFLSSQI